MSYNIINEDVRNKKTEKALYAAMFSLLQRLSYKKITIKGICEEALVSRAAFYAHFHDKYDLLKRWMTELWPMSFSSDDSYEYIEEAINNRIQENMVIIKNLVFEADDETFDILFNFVLSTLTDGANTNEGEAALKNIVLSNFYAGGIISYLLWHVKNKFPSDVPLMNRHLYKIIREFQDWHSKLR